MESMRRLSAAEYSYYFYFCFTKGKSDFRCNKDR